MNIEIPDKFYFKIGEVSRLVGVKPYVIRYWESEFPDLSPVKSRTNQRLYRKTDIEFLAAVKELLYEQKYTVRGAKKELKSFLKNQKQSKQEASQADLNLVSEDVFEFGDVVDELKKLKAQIENFSLLPNQNNSKESEPQ